MRRIVDLFIPPLPADPSVQARKRFLAALLCILQALSLWAQVATAPAARATASAKPIPEQHMLPNGLKVVFLEDHSFPVVCCMVWYHVGSRNETLGTTGLSHLVEHLMFASAGTLRKGEIGALIARAGGKFNGYTSDDFTTFFEVLPASQLELALKLESERMRASSFTARDVHDEIANIQHEFENGEKDVAEILSREVRAAAYHQHPYHNPTMGWRTDVENLTPQQARAFYEAYFRPDNATIVVAGDFKPQAAFALVRKYFSTIAKGARKAPVCAGEPAQRGERRVVVKHAGKQEVLEVAYHGTSLDDPDAPALTVLEKLLNAAFGGRLKARLVSAKVCTSAQAAFEAKKDPGLFRVSCQATPGTGQDQVLEAWDGVVSQLKAQPVTEQELRRARNQAEFAYASEVDGPYRAAFHLGYFDVLSQWQKAFTWQERLRAVTAADIQRVAKKYFNADNRVIGWLSGAAAPRPQPKPAPASEQPAPKDPARPAQSSPPMGARATGYKSDDFALGPEDTRRLTMVAQAAAPPSVPGPGTAPPPADAAAPSHQDELPPPSAEAASDSAATTATPLAAPMLPVTPKLPAADASASPASAGAARPPSGGPPAAPASAAPARPPTGAQPEAFLRRVHKKVLANGLTLVVLESRLSPVVQVMGAVKAGSIYDPADKKGLSMLTAQALNYGSVKRNRYQQLLAQEDIGLPPAAMMRFEGSLETINFQTKCLSRDLPAQLDLLAETLSEPSFSEGDIEKSRQDVLTSLKRAEESLPEKVERAVLRSAIAPASAYYPPDAVELVKSIGNLKAADARSFHSGQVAPNATFLLLAGDISMAQAEPMVTKAFSAWAARPTGSPPTLQVAAKRILRTTIPVKDAGESVVCLGQLLQAHSGQPDYAALLVADCALTKHPIFSRLGQSFSSEPLLSEAVSSDEIRSRMEPLGRFTAWSLSLSVKPDVVSRAVQSMLDENRKFASSGISQDELMEARRYLLGALPVRRFSNLQAAGQGILDAALQGGDPDYLGRLMSAVSRVGLDTVNKCIRSTLKPDQSTMVIAGTGSAIQAVRTQALSGQPKAAAARPASAGSAAPAKKP